MKLTIPPRIDGQHVNTIRAAPDFVGEYNYGNGKLSIKIRDPVHLEFWIDLDISYLALLEIIGVDELRRLIG